MNKEILEQIKQEYKKMEKISKGDYSEITELEKNPIVQQYKNLLDLKETFITGDHHYREADIFGKIIDKYSHGLVEQTNEIWFWFYDISIGEYEKLFNTSLDRTDKDSIISVYLDLENSKKVVTIPIEEQDTFEATHHVIRGKRTISDSSDRYYNARYEFFNLCIREGQDLAIQTMIQEEHFRPKEIEELKKQELAELSDCLIYGMITKEEYSKKRQIILQKNK